MQYFLCKKHNLRLTYSNETKDRLFDLHFATDNENTGSGKLSESICITLVIFLLSSFLPLFP